MAATTASELRELTDDDLVLRLRESKEELFNLRHSQLWNVVERVYGVFKIYFRIFQSARDGLTMATQVKLIYALLAVHNWINSHRGSP